MSIKPSKDTYYSSESI